MLSSSKDEWDLAGLLQIFFQALISLSLCAWRNPVPKLVCLPLRVTFLFDPECKCHGPETSQLSMFCNFFKGNWFLFFNGRAKELLLTTLVWSIKGREKELRVNVVSFCVFIWKFLISIKGSGEKSLWNSIQGLPAYTKILKDVWLDPLKMTKNMDCIAPGFIIFLTLLSLYLASYLHSICVVLC